MKRTPLSRRTPLRRAASEPHRTPWPRKGKPRRNSHAATPIPASVRLLVADRSGGVCEFCGRTAAVHMHHRKLRSHGGEHTLDNLIHLCQADHEWAHSYPGLAVEVGLIVRSTADPADVRVLPLIPFYGQDGRP